jgi:hypothetical protein
MPRSARVVAALGVAALLVSMLFAVTRSKQFYADHNQVRSNDFATVLAGGEELCQGPLTEPYTKGTAAVEFVTGAQSPPVSVSLRSTDGFRTVRGSLPGGRPPGQLAVPVDEIPKSGINAVMCLRNRGTTPLPLGGQSTDGTGLRIDGVERPALIRIAYVRSGRESWFAMLPTIAHRFGIVKTTIAGAWMFWVVLALIAGVAVTVLFTLLRPGPEEVS